MTKSKQVGETFFNLMGASWPFEASMNLPRSIALKAGLAKDNTNLWHLKIYIL